MSFEVTIQPRLKAMYTPFNTGHTKLNKAMTEEQFEQIVSAILDGKYSWACVLILSFAGYNPLHYIPYRTYNRLMKENQRKDLKKPDRSEGKDLESQTCAAMPTSSRFHPGKNKIEDLSYLEVAEDEAKKVKGRGILNFYVDDFKALCGEALKAFHH